jgi:hypothetical protein
VPSRRAVVTRVIPAQAGQSRIEKRFTPAHRDHYESERAGLSVLSRIPELSGFVPQLLDEDDSSSMIAIEDIGQCPSLDSMLRASDALAAERALIETARRLGMLHGYARAHTLAFDDLAPPPVSAGCRLASGAVATIAFCERAVGRPCSELVPALSALAEDVDSLGSLTTVTLGDLAPSNVLLGPRGPVFIDLEYAAVRHAFYDAMFWRCICPFPGAVADAMEAAYVSGLAAAGLELAAESVHAGMTLLAAHRLFWTLSWNMGELFESDREYVPGVSSRAILRRYLQEFATLATRSPLAQRELQDVARELVSRLALLWPEAKPATVDFPCFG